MLSDLHASTHPDPDQFLGIVGYVCPAAMAERLGVERSGRTLFLALCGDVAPYPAFGWMWPAAIAVCAALPWLPRGDDFVVSGVMDNLHVTHQTAVIVFSFFRVVAHWLPQLSYSPLGGRTN